MKNNTHTNHTVIQFGSVAAWYAAAGPPFSPGAVGAWQWLAAAALLAVGQALNVGIYRAIGHPGVYYGFKMGHVVPWVDGFPFNVVAHPQCESLVGLPAVGCTVRVGV